MPDVTLFVPGLFDTEIDSDDSATDELQALELLLARAHRTAVSEASSNTMLCELFGYLPQKDEDIPMAAIGRLMDDEKRPTGYWMRADPVHLRADQKSLNLLDVSNLSLTQHDALALAASVQRSFTEMGWELEVPVPTRWYVKMNDKPRIRTSEIQSVVGKDIQQYMPSGEDAGTWHRLMNELQMQLHNADINKLREERGELPVNSLWFWGSGTLPDLLERRWTRVCSDDNNTQGLSMLSNTPCLPLPESAESLCSRQDGQASVLVVMSEFQIAMLQRQQRRQRLLQFEKSWCRPLLKKIQSAELNSLRIITRLYEFRINKFALMKFWSVRRPFNSYVH